MFCQQISVIIFKPFINSLLNSLVWVYCNNILILETLYFFFRKKLRIIWIIMINKCFFSMVPIDVASRQFLYIKDYRKTKQNVITPSIKKKTANQKENQIIIFFHILLWTVAILLSIFCGLRPVNIVLRQ